MKSNFKDDPNMVKVLHRGSGFYIHTSLANELIKRGINYQQYLAEERKRFISELAAGSVIN